MGLGIERRQLSASSRTVCTPSDDELAPKAPPSFLPNDFFDSIDPEPTCVQALNCRHQRHNSLVLTLFDHLVGAHQNRSRYSEVKRLGGLEVQDQLKLCRHLNG